MHSSALGPMPDLKVGLSFVSPSSKLGRVRVGGMDGSAVCAGVCAYLGQ